jgi:hypothetical protein
MENPVTAVATSADNNTHFMTVVAKKLQKCSDRSRELGLSTWLLIVDPVLYVEEASSDGRTCSRSMFFSPNLLTQCCQLLKLKWYGLGDHDLERMTLSFFGIMWWYG